MTQNKNTLLQKTLAHIDHCVQTNTNEALNAPPLLSSIYALQNMYLAVL